MADASPADAGENWIPLESNPDVLTDFAHGLGVPQTSPYRFTDVWGLDEGVLAFMPRPVLAVVFLFPISESYESYRKAEDARIAQEGQTEDPELYFTKQTIGNACGTIGLLHALGNSLEELKVPETAPLAKLVKAARGKNPLERGKMLETSKELAEMHEAMGGSGQTAAPAADSDVNLHFVAFVQGPGNRRLYELDGRRPAPIDHGECEDLLAGAAKVVQRYIDREAGDLHFVLLALCSAEE
ncbi:hypothetical protein DFJ74DRAFT_604233 [Hyaloraphidium curvatum]|nr:hypothetical protein DFJ74DRAFT_604233 [Hyaloraphidium curvatum]